MEIVIACGAMPFGPRTLEYKSLGGSETAALMLGKELSKRGHKVTMFCNNPRGQQDEFTDGAPADDGVRYIDLPHFGNYASNTEIDLLIAVRDPGLATQLAQAKKKVLWMHDIATKRGMQRAFDQMQHEIDEVWTVSEWHKRQVHETTGYPLSHIVALRNGCVQWPEEVPTLRSEKQILYAARPERGLDNLIRPGGIMEQLPDYKLIVAMYAHFPEHMRGYYEQIFARMKAMPNVEFVGGKPNGELRQLMRESAAYIYPTQFEETSCIIARECMDTLTPMLTTKTGALPETLGDCGIYFEDWLAARGIIEPEDKTSTAWSVLFAKFFKDTVERVREVGDKPDDNIPDQGQPLDVALKNMERRTDLYWDGVAEMVEKFAKPRNVKPFSRAWSMIQDGDVIPAIAFMRAFFVDQELSDGDQNFLMSKLWDQVEQCYPFLFGKKSLDQHYEDIYTGKIGRADNELKYMEDLTEGPRFIHIANEISKLPPGSRILEVGCGAGHIIATLAKHLPQYDYTGIEFSPAAVECVNKGALERDRSNLRAFVADGSTPIADQFGHEAYDAVIISEVLEHVEEPWDVLQKAEACVRKGGRVVITVPYGPWEQGTFWFKDRFLERAHIWHINKWMLRQMAGHKTNPNMVGLVFGVVADHRGYGNIFFAYDADHTPINSVNALEKALEARPRQTCAAAIIAYNNQDTIVRMLDSIDHQVQFIQIAHGPSTDDTLQLIERWMENHPWMFYRIIDVPKIEPYKYGFDHARNDSVKDLDDLVDWVLWIDTDEYISGHFGKYLRHNCLQAYMISQHHFSVSPKGAPAQVDRPARLFRTGQGYRANGHIHEHFEVPEGGPGRAALLEDVDIGHPGYVNEEVRRARFSRNFPFLVWDHEDNAHNQRRLHHFLWFRDIIHRMRYCIQNKEVEPARTLAEDAIKYYDENYAAMATFGPGLFMSLTYLAEAYTFLGRGVGVQLHLALDDRSATIAGKFENYEQVERVLAQVLKPEFADRTSRYY